MKSVGIFFIVVSVICVGISIFGGWNLVEMINDQVEYASAIAGLGNNATLPVPPADRFPGSGLIGMLFSTFFALVAAVLFWAGCAEIKSANDKEDDG